MPAQGSRTLILLAAAGALGWAACTDKDPARQDLGRPRDTTPAADGTTQRDGLPPRDGPGGRDATAPVEASVGGGGGVLSTADGAVTLEVPAKALGKEVKLTIAAASGAPADGVGSAFAIGPGGTTFKEPALLTFRYAGLLPASASPASLRVGQVVQGKWVRQGVPLVDPVNKTVSARIAHLSVYGLYFERCKPGASAKCAVDYEACVSGLSPQPVCGIPCVDTTDCPHPLYCVKGGTASQPAAAGMCALLGCHKDQAACAPRSGYACSQVYGYHNASPASFGRLCLPGCSETLPTTSVCPRQLRCVSGACSDIGACTSDSGCAPLGYLCYHGGLLTWAGSTGECLPCNIGCDCSQPSCPCQAADQKRCASGPPFCTTSADCHHALSCVTARAVCRNGQDCWKEEKGCSSVPCCPFQKCGDACLPDCTTHEHCWPWQKCVNGSCQQVF